MDNNLYLTKAPGQDDYEHPDWLVVDGWSHNVQTWARTREQSEVDRDALNVYRAVRKAFNEPNDSPIKKKLIGELENIEVIKLHWDSIKGVEEIRVYRPFDRLLEMEGKEFPIEANVYFDISISEHVKVVTGVIYDN